MSSPNPHRPRAGLGPVLERYSHVRHVVCGLGPEPCVKADLDRERACAEELEREHGCQFGWHYNQPFDPAYYHRARPVESGAVLPPPDPPGELRVGMVVVPEVINRNGLIAAHSVVEVLGG